jgi:hypothetical protein
MERQTQPRRPPSPVAPARRTLYTTRIICEKSEENYADRQETLIRLRRAYLPPHVPRTCGNFLSDHLLSRLVLWRRMTNRARISASAIGGYEFV